jgi:hypothetical protein
MLGAGMTPYARVGRRAATTPYARVDYIPQSRTKNWVSWLFIFSKDTNISLGIFLHLGLWVFNMKSGRICGDCPGGEHTFPLLSICCQSVGEGFKDYVESMAPGTHRNLMGSSQLWKNICRLMRSSSVIGLLNMELDLESVFGLHVPSCTHWLRPRNLHPPRIWAHKRGRYWSAKIDDISLWPVCQCEPWTSPVASFLVDY